MANVEFVGFLRWAREVTRDFGEKFKGISKDKPIYTRVTLKDNTTFYVLVWTSWEEPTTKEKIFFFIKEGGVGVILTEFHNISKIEFFYEKPEDAKDIIGFKGEVSELLSKK